MWSSFQLAPIIPVLLDVFPDSIYIMQTRNPLDWAESIYNLLPKSAGTFPGVIRALIGGNNELPSKEQTKDFRNKMGAMRTFGFPVSASMVASNASKILCWGNETYFTEGACW